MADSQPAQGQHGLPWPDAYADLQTEIGERWHVEGAIYLVRKLSGGRSGALVYAADLDSRDFAGQAILKFDEFPDPQSQEENEAERHRLAFERAPDYAAAHFSHVVNSYTCGTKLAILSTIAGRGLEYANPWSRCSYDEQLASAREVSRDILEEWNAEYRLTQGLRAPQDLLHGWLDYRLDPVKGRIHSFILEQHSLTPDQASFIFDGNWFPNPLTFAEGKMPLPEHLQIRAATGNVHGDLHGHNVLVARQPQHETTYFIIDLAMYEADQYLFYDHAYFELTHLLKSRDKAAAANWLEILDSFERQGHAGAVRAGDDLGIVQLVAAIRRELFEWIDRHEANRLSHMESQVLLPRVASGLAFAHRRISTESRSIAFLYAAHSLKELLVLHGVEWPKYGPPIAIAAESAPPAIETEGTTASAEVPDKPAIAVMPFENLGGDPDQEYFADGVTEDLITELARIDWLMVIAQESTLAYRGKAIDAREIGKELGAQYVATGGVRKADDKIRVTVHLIEAESRRELWGERYDRKIVDVFAVQDEIAGAIVANIDSEAKASERELAARKRDPLNLWEMYQRAMWHFFKMAPEDDDRAVRELQRAIEIAPDYAPAHAALSFFQSRRFVLGNSPDPAADLAAAAENAERAVALDPGSVIARIAHARVLSLQGEHDAAITEGERATQLNPSSANAFLTLGGRCFGAAGPRKPWRHWSAPYASAPRIPCCSLSRPSRPCVALISGTSAKRRLLPTRPRRPHHERPSPISLWLPSSPAPTTSTKRGRQSRKRSAFTPATDSPTSRIRFSTWRPHSATASSTTCERRA